MPVPLIKLAAVAARQVSKPLANVIKNRAENWKWFQKLSMTFAQKYYRFEQTITRRFYERGEKVSKVPAVKIKQEKAVQMASDLLGEVIIFSVAAGALAYEYRRSALKEYDAEQKRETRLRQLEDQVNSLKERVTTYEDASSGTNDKVNE